MTLKAPMELMPEGTVYRGVVRHVAEFGLFVELVAGQKDAVLLFDRTPYPEIARKPRIG